jgi:hypothetical protein
VKQNEARGLRRASQIYAAFFTTKTLFKAAGR